MPALEPTARRATQRAATDPAGPSKVSRTSGDLSDRIAGANAGRTATVGRLAVQRAARVGSVDDPLERQADAVADRVTRGPARTSSSQASSPMAATASWPAPASPGGPVARAAAVSGTEHWSSTANPEPSPRPAPTPLGTGADSVHPVAEVAIARTAGIADGVDVRRDMGSAATVGTPTPPGSPGPEPAGGPTGGPVSDETATLLETSAGEGHPLSAPIRSELEASLGADFSGVRIHNDTRAAALTQSLGAVALTRGSDIYFAAGAYQPEASEGRRLLVHELTHVVQQTGAGDSPNPPAGPAVGRSVAMSPVTPVTPPQDGAAPTAATPGSGPIARAAKKGKAKAPTSPIPTAPGDIVVTNGIVNPATSTLTVTAMNLPAVKKREMRAMAKQGLTSTPIRPSGGRMTGQRAFWEGLVGGPVKKLVDQLETTKAPDGSETYNLKFTRGGHDFYLLGNREEVTAALIRPSWDAEGNSTVFDIDHKLEWQLGGGDDNPKDNLWLLESAANQSAGNRIKTEKEQVIGKMLEEAGVPGLTVDKVRNWKNITLNLVQIGDDKAFPDLTIAGQAHRFWLPADLGKSQKVFGGKPKAVGKISGTEDRLSIFAGPTGGHLKQVAYPFKKGGWDLTSLGGKDAALVKITDVTWSKKGPATAAGQEVGSISFDIKENPLFIKEGEPNLTIVSISGIGYGGFIRTGKRILRASMFSPIEFSDMVFDPHRGLAAVGRIDPVHPLLRKHAEFGVVLDAGGAAIYARLLGTDLALPGPFKVTGGFIGLNYRLPKSLAAEGEILFEIGTLAKGKIGARKSLTGDGGFGVSGELTFDQKIFDKATLAVAYTDGKWSLAGDLTIGPDKVKGIKAGTASLRYDNGRLTANGTVEPDMPALTKGSLSLAYDAALGSLTVEGLLGLRKLPGIEGGEVHAKVQRAKTGEAWSLAGGVTVRPDIPGVTGKITGNYEDGAFLVEGLLGYQRGLLDGKLQVGVSNRALDAAGLPRGPVGPDLWVYGSSELALKLTPWLIGTARVELTPKGTIKVRGGIALPDRFSLFDRKEMPPKEVFSAAATIPLFAGIVARIGGGLELFAGIGPGWLVGTALTVDYDPEREDATAVQGSVGLQIPASAGLNVFVQAGIGLGVGVASATGGIKLGGALGLQGDLTAKATLLWTRSGGLVLDALTRLSASPMFRLTIDAYVLVESFGFELYSHEWKLAAFDFGSSYVFAVSLPVHAEKGAFDLGFDKVTFEYPRLDANSLAEQVISQKLDE